MNHQNHLFFVSIITVSEIRVVRVHLFPHTLLNMHFSVNYANASVFLEVDLCVYVMCVLSKFYRKHGKLLTTRSSHHHRARSKNTHLHVTTQSRHILDVRATHRTVRYSCVFSDAVQSSSRRTSTAPNRTKDHTNTPISSLKR